MARRTTIHFNSRFVGTISISKAFQNVVRQIRKGGRIARPPLHRLGWLRLLEVNPCPNFHLTGGENRTGDSPKVRRSRKSQTTRIRWLVVVKDVSELNRERRAHAFRELDVLGNCRVHIPPIQASQVSNAAAACVNSQDAAAEVS